MEEEKSLVKVKERDSFSKEEDLRPKVRRLLLNMAIDSYKEVMLNGKMAERKQAADAIMELLGKKHRDVSQTANFNLNIPPEYFKRVFGEGLPKITQLPPPPDTDGTSAAEADFKVITVSGAEDAD